MTRELILEGQRVDLAPDTDITLEFVNNILGDVGKIHLSRSYTVKIPKTLKNARILDDPGRPGHESAMERRVFSARFNRNGIDLLGEAEAYLLATTTDSYEVALVWNTLPGLQALSQSKATLNDLTGLPRLTWIGANGHTPDYFSPTDVGGALFAWYESGLGALKYPTVNAGTHPAMRMSTLLDMIMSQAGVSYAIDSERAGEALNHTYLLAAPDHKPDAAMERESGSIAGSVTFVQATVNNRAQTQMRLQNWTHGWDAPSAATGRTNVFNTGGNGKHRVLINLRVSAAFEGAYIDVSGVQIGSNVIKDQEALDRFYFQPDENGGYYCAVDEEISLGNWSQYSINFGGLDSSISETPTAYWSGLPLFAVNRVHNAISIAHDNVFLLQGNLPDITQWDFVKGCMALFGLAPVSMRGRVIFADYKTLFDTSNAVDWTRKLDMTAAGVPEESAPSVDQWARLNNIVFAKNEGVVDPTATITVSDETLSESRDFYKLPFAASRFSTALHYEVGKDNELTDLNIEPRVMTLVTGEEGRNELRFTDNLSGDGLVMTYYSELQAVMRKPVRLSERIRLNELDLVNLDLRRPVYLGQYGHYYAVLKIQTSATDLCKVELIQIA